MKRKTSSLLVFALSAVALLGVGATLASCGGGNAPADSSQSQNFRITVEGEGCEVSGLPEGNVAAEGTRIRFTVKATAEGKVVGTVKVNDEVLTAGGGGRYSFTMPAKDVVIKVTVVGVSSISVDTSAVKTAFLVGSTFESTGLKISAKYDSGETMEITTGFSVTAPDLTTEGTKAVTVSYGGKTATYDVKVGSMERVGIDIANVDGKATLNINGTFTGFATAAELTVAAKGAILFDIQYNQVYSNAAPSWDRLLKTSEVQYQDNGTGAYKFSVDLSTLMAASGKGVGYTIHFGPANVEGQDIGEAGNWAATQSLNKEIQIGNNKYRLVSYPESEEGVEFWGNYGLIVLDETAPSMTAQTVELKVEEDKAYAIVKGTYTNVETGGFEGNLLCDLTELNTWVVVDALTGTASFVATPGEVANCGTFEVRFDITGKLGTGNPYFFHFHFDPKGSPTGDGHNINWDANAMEVQQIVDPSNGGMVTFSKNPRTSPDWASSYATLTFEGADYAKAQSASFVANGEKALFTLSGIYAGIVNNENGDYYLDAQALDNWTYLFGREATDPQAELKLTEGAEAGKGTFDLSIDLAGKMNSGTEYIFHFGAASAGSTDHPNVTINVEESSFHLGAGTYSIRTLSGKEGDWSWQNGLLSVSYVAD